MSVTGAVPVTANNLLLLTEHPLQRSGARSIAVLAGRENVEDVTGEDLGRVAEQIVTDVVQAAIAGKDYLAYDWWKILFAMYPNAKPTPARRTRDRAELTAEVKEFFAPDRADDALPAVCLLRGPHRRPLGEVEPADVRHHSDPTGDDPYSSFWSTTRRRNATPRRCARAASTCTGCNAVSSRANCRPRSIVRW